MCWLVESEIIRERGDPVADLGLACCKLVAELRAVRHSGGEYIDAGCEACCRYRVGR